MLWINNQLSTIPTITDLLFPSLACLVASLAFISLQLPKSNTLAENASMENIEPITNREKFIFGFGLLSLLSVPVFNELTGLPPYLWTLTDLLYFPNEQENVTNTKIQQLTVPSALSKLDTAGILFFLGILMSIGVLDKSGLLKELAIYLNQTLPNLNIIATVIGLASVLIDNVPLVAATIGMCDLTEFATDDSLWQLIAYCAGTGGSILVIGSASGVALMGLEKADFLWYLKNVSAGAAVGYFVGIGVYLLQNAFLAQIAT